MAKSAPEKAKSDAKAEQRGYARGYEAGWDAALRCVADEAEERAKVARSRATRRA
jgi:hypothetical protein